MVSNFSCFLPFGHAAPHHKVYDPLIRNEVVDVGDVLTSARNYLGDVAYSVNKQRSIRKVQNITIRIIFIENINSIKVLESSL